MLEELSKWSSADDPRSRVLWLHGPAGSGKSAIAQSLCQKVEAEGSLGGSFFFKRGHSSRGNASKLFSTIAYQLALHLPTLNHIISQIVAGDPSIITRSLSIQLQRLIVEPCQQMTPTRTLTIIIDGLDECEGQNIQQEVLRSIGNAVQGQAFPLRFLVASRPEPYIQKILNAPGLVGLHKLVNVEESFSDVRRYLQDEFTRIQQEHSETMPVLSTPWPEPGVVDALVQNSSGYFIYASTVIQFIDDMDFRPTERLEVVMGIKEPDFGSPFGALDQLYSQILSAVPRRPQLLKILAVITAGFWLSIPHVEQFLSMEPGDFHLALRGLHSVIKIDSEEDEFTIHHASFRDFLDDPTRSGTFYVGGVTHRTDLSYHVLKAFLYTHGDPSLNQRGHVAW